MMRITPQFLAHWLVQRDLVVVRVMRLPDEFRLVHQLFPVWPRN